MCRDYWASLQRKALSGSDLHLFFIACKAVLMELISHLLERSFKSASEGTQISALTPNDPFLLILMLA